MLGQGETVKSPLGLRLPLRLLLLAGLSAGLLSAGSGQATPHGSAPSFARATNYATGGDPVGIVTGDLNGDTEPDLATANLDSGTVSVLLNGGDGRFSPKHSYAVGPLPQSVVIGDLNGDGKPDLAVAELDENKISVLLNRGDGRFQARQDYRIGGFVTSVAIGDLNRDGKPDLATADGFSMVSVLLNKGDGSFQAKRNYRAGAGPSSVAIGDLNGDGALDLAAGNEGHNAVSVLLNRGDGTFQARRSYRTGGDLYAAAPASVTIGDLNRDGKPDLATANEDADTISVLLNRGGGRFRARRDYKVAGSPMAVEIGDLNEDGKPDLATANAVVRGFAGADRASVLVNEGGGRFQARLGYPTGQEPASVAIGDLNGDDKLDLATANRYSSTVSVLLNSPGLCTVQAVRGRRLPAARRTLARANCRVGKIHRVDSGVRRGRVITQRPSFGAVLSGRSKVNLVVSRGRKR
jgi:hypothetical protein